MSDRDTTILVDAYDGSSAKANIMTFSKGAPKGVASTEETLVFDWPGEFESNSIYMQAVEESENCVFCFHFLDYTACHLGRLPSKLSEEALEKIGDVDVLFVPVGNDEALDAKKALEVIDQIDPRMVIPTFYRTDDSEEKLQELEGFLEVMGKKEVEKVAKLKLSKSALSDDKTELVVLERSK